MRQPVTSSQAKIFRASGPSSATTRAGPAAAGPGRAIAAAAQRLRRPGSRVAAAGGPGVTVTVTVELPVAQAGAARAGRGCIKKALAGGGLAGARFRRRRTGPEGRAAVTATAGMTKALFKSSPAGGPRARRASDSV